MAVNPAKMIADILINVPLVDGAGDGSGWRLFRDSEPTTPDTSVTVYNSVGRAPNPKYLLDYPSVQVRVRASAAGQDAAFDKLAAIKDALLGRDPATVLGSRLVSITMPGDIMPLGRDDTGRPIYTATFNLIVEPANDAGDNRVPL